MKKRLTAFLLTLALVLSLMTGMVSAAHVSFSDVASDAWYYADVMNAVAQGLVSGKSANLYDPEGQLTVAEAVKLAACLHQRYHEGSVSLVNGKANWYATYMDYAVQNSILTLDRSGEANDPITRADFVGIFSRALPKTEFGEINQVGTACIPDVHPNVTLNADTIYAFYRAGILTGSDAEGCFYPDSTIKRAEVAAILTRMTDKSTRKSIHLDTLMIAPGLEWDGNAYIAVAYLADESAALAVGVPYTSLEYKGYTTENCPYVDIGGYDLYFVVADSLLGAGMTITDDTGKVYAENAQAAFIRCNQSDILPNCTISVQDLYYSPMLSGADGSLVVPNEGDFDIVQDITDYNYGDSFTEGAPVEGGSYETGYVDGFAEGYDDGYYMESYYNAVYYNPYPAGSWDALDYDGGFYDGYDVGYNAGYDAGINDYNLYGSAGNPYNLGHVYGYSDGVYDGTNGDWYGSYTPELWHDQVTDTESFDWGYDDGYQLGYNQYAGSTGNMPGDMGEWAVYGNIYLQNSGAFQTLAVEEIDTMTWQATGNWYYPDMNPDAFAEIEIYDWDGTVESYAIMTPYEFAQYLLLNGSTQGWVYIDNQGCYQVTEGWGY